MIIALKAMIGMVTDMEVKADKLLLATQAGFITATDLADYLVKNFKIPFREAHHITGKIVKLAEKKKLDLADLQLSELQKIEPRIQANIYDILTVAAAVKSRNSYGGTAPIQVKKALKTAKKKNMFRITIILLTIILISCGKKGELYLPKSGKVEQKRKLMDHFNYKNNILHAENVAIPELAKKVGTPFYLYSNATLVRHFKVMSQALTLSKKLICFAVKANSNISILKLLAAEGAGADVVSQGEIYRALTAGVAADKIVFSGVGKNAAEIAYGLTEKILQFNVESLEEIQQINQIAAVMKVKAPIAIRVNPNVGAGANDKISTGKKGDKFGIDLDMAEQAVQLAMQAENINFRGLSVHIGSQINDIAAFALAFRKLFEFVQKLEQANFEVKIIDLGGGVGVPYSDHQTIAPEAYGLLIKELVQEFNFESKEFILSQVG